jgi:3-oxoacyl-[acyl-carrier protein] reductase
MRERRWGRIVGIQSSSVKEPIENLDLSNGIRPGIAGLMKAIVPELAKDGITINLVLPGIFLTDRVRPPGVDDATIQARAGACVPLGRLGDPAELGSLVAFLASDRAAYITGTVYQIDGGLIRSNI